MPAFPAKRTTTAYFTHDERLESEIGNVYSTNPNFKSTPRRHPQIETSPPNDRTCRVWLDRKQRGGKTVTLVKGFVGSDADWGNWPACSKPAAAWAGQPRTAKSSSRATTATGWSKSSPKRVTNAKKGRRMTRPAPMRRFAAILFLLGFLFIGGKSVRAQYYSWGADAAALRWKHLRTEDVRVVFPDTASRWRTEPCIISRRYAPRLHTVSATRR